MGSVLYFLYTLCFVISRLLAFVLFAYTFEPGSWGFPVAAVAYHVSKEIYITSVPIG